MLKATFFILALLSYLVVHLAITKGRILLAFVAEWLQKQKAEFNLFQGVSQNGRNKIRFNLFLGFTVNTVFAAWVYLISNLWGFFMTGEPFGLLTIYVFFMILLVGAILLKHTVNAYKAMENSNV